MQTCLLKVLSVVNYESDPKLRNYVFMHETTKSALSWLHIPQSIILAPLEALSLANQFWSILLMFSAFLCANEKRP